MKVLSDLIITAAERRAKELRRQRVNRITLGVSIVVTLILLTALALFSCEAKAGFYVELGVGQNGIGNNDWTGKDSTGCMAGLGYTYNYAQGLTLDFSYRHNSQCALSGEEEDSLDSIGVYARYYF